MWHEDFPALEALKAGDEMAWSAAFPHLWPIALRAAHDCGAQLTLEEAEDVAIEAIRLTIDQIETVPSTDALRGLVCTIAKWRAISLARQKSALKRVPALTLAASELAANEAAPVEPVDEKDPFAQLQAAELAALLRDALSGLDPRTKELVFEKFVLGMTYEELSAKHRVPLGTLCAKVARGLAKVRTALNDSPGLMKELKSFLR
jgi:RNA polymerase sigma factor (sigma-70 family)